MNIFEKNWMAATGFPVNEKINNVYKMYKLSHLSDYIVGGSNIRFRLAKLLLNN